MQHRGGGSTVSVKRVKERKEGNPSESRAKTEQRASQFCPIWYGMLRHLSHVM